jgi:hypothetical protein
VSPYAAFIGVLSFLLVAPFRLFATVIAASDQLQSDMFLPEKFKLISFLSGQGLGRNS